MKIKKLEEISSAYKDAAGTAAARYRDAIPEIKWQAAALEGQSLYEEQLRKPEILARRAKKLAKVSDAEFQKALLEKGVPVLASRITAAANKQAAGFKPYHEVLAELALPKRSADAMVNIDNRLKAVVKALVAKKAELEKG